MPTEQPNILLVTTDQQRGDTTGPAAPSFMRTPHLDMLRREGVDFRSAYADCPVCVPARVGIMTGKFVFSHGMPGNGQSSAVMGREGTLPTCLRELGYQTAAIGKMHFGPQRARHGFDEMILPEDYYRQMARSGQPLQPMRHGLGQNELYAGMATVPESMTLTSWIAEQCVEYIRERRDPTAPFFLWCSFSKPHPPLDPPEPYYSMYRDCPLPEPVYGDWSEEGRMPQAMRRLQQRWSLDLVPPEVIREARAAYLGLITQIDYNLGRVLGGLQDLNLLRDTLILFTSDHGEYLGDHHTGCKVYFHEPSARIPFLLRLPKCWEDRRHGTEVSSPVTHADVLPTLVRAAGGEPPEGVDGQDLIALARGESAAPRGWVYATAGASPPEYEYVGLTDGRWKYIWYPEGPTEQLFDLEADPQELHDLAGQPGRASQQEALREELTGWLAEHGPAYLSEGRLPGWPVREERVEDRRNESWPGLHTEYYDGDVRH